MSALQQEPVRNPRHMGHPPQFPHVAYDTGRHSSTTLGQRGATLAANAAVLTRLDPDGVLGVEERLAFLHALDRPRHVAAGSPLGLRRPEEVGVRLVQSGYACRHIGLSDGRRQIIGLLLPGDICELNTYLATENECDMVALTPCVVVEMSRRALADLTRLHPRLGDALWRMAKVDEAILFERVLSLGQRSARERLAQFFCEFLLRAHAVGLVTEGRCILPISQSDLADLLGLSLVHTNRSLQALRSAGLLTLKSRQLTVLDLEGLRREAQFNGYYLSGVPDGSGVGDGRCRVAPFSIFRTETFG